MCEKENIIGFMYKIEIDEEDTKRIGTLQYNFSMTFKFFRNKKPRDFFTETSIENFVLITPDNFINTFLSFQTEICLLIDKGVTFKDLFLNNTGLFIHVNYNDIDYTPLNGTFDEDIKEIKKNFNI